MLSLSFCFKLLYVYSLHVDLLSLFMAVTVALIH